MKKGKRMKVKGWVRHEDYLLPSYYQYVTDTRNKIGRFNVMIFILMLFSIDTIGSIVISFDFGMIVLGYLYSRHFLKAGNMGTITAFHRREYASIGSLIHIVEFLRAGALSRLFWEGVILILMVLSLGMPRVLDLIGTEIIFLFSNPTGYLAAAALFGFYIFRMHYQDRIVTMREFFENVRYVMRHRNMSVVEAREYTFTYWKNIQNERKGIAQSVPVANPDTGQMQSQPQLQTENPSLEGVEGVRMESTSEPVDLEPKRRKART